MMPVAIELAERMHVRWMIRRDMPEVMNNDCTYTKDERWTEDDYLKELKEANAIGMVCDIGDQVLGHMVYELHKNKLVVVRFAVDSAHLRCGIGTKMLDKLKSKLSPQRRNEIHIHVDEYNLNGQLFLRSQAFFAVPQSNLYVEHGTVLMIHNQRWGSQ